MSSTSTIGILLTGRTNKNQIGVIEFDPSGLLVFRVIHEGLHVYALKPVERILNENGLEKPLYVKYAQLLKRRKKLPSRILEQEARFYADILNNRNPPLEIAGESIKATVMHYSSQESK